MTVSDCSSYVRTEPITRSHTSKVDTKVTYKNIVKMTDVRKTRYKGTRFLRIHTAYLGAVSKHPAPTVAQKFGTKLVRAQHLFTF